jgi:hypothetical protein
MPLPQGWRERLPASWLTVAAGELPLASWTNGDRNGKHSGESFCNHNRRVSRRLYYANKTEPQIPARFAQVVEAIHGLNNAANFSAFDASPKIAPKGPASGFFGSTKIARKVPRTLSLV